jgi:hypothetical protein
MRGIVITRELTVSFHHPPVRIWRRSGSRPIELQMRKSFSSPNLILEDFGLFSEGKLKGLYVLLGEN